MMLTQLADVARSAGLTVVELKDWKTRTSMPGESMIDVKTITCHHTANGGAPGNAPSLAVVRDGRPGLNGPLAHFLLARDGTVYVVAAGHCNHAGVSLKTAYTNSYAVGIEAEAVGVPGTKGDWPEVQMVAYARLCAALRAEFGLAVADVRGHKETCSPVGRKSDPDFDMGAFRQRVGTVDLRQPMETDMPLTNDDADLVISRLLATKIDLSAAAAAAMSLPGETPRAASDQVSVSYVLQWGGPGLFRELGETRALKAQNVALAAQVTALTAAVSAIAASSPDAVKAAFDAGIAALNADIARIDVVVEPPV